MESNIVIKESSNKDVTTEKTSSEQLNSRQSAKRKIMTITVKEWNTCALWSWNTSVDTCTICKNSLSDTCVECQANNNSSGNSNNTKRSSTDNKVIDICTSALTEYKHVSNALNRVSNNNNNNNSYGNCVSNKNDTTHKNKNVDNHAAAIYSSCAIAWGKCTHVFHLHCINRWVRHRPLCPLCGRTWELYKLTANE